MTTTNPQRQNKQLSMEEAVTRIEDGMRVALGGFGIYNRPMAFVRELVRQNRRGLTLIGTTNGPEAEVLAGAGCLEAIETSYVGLEKFGLARRVRHLVESGRVKIVDYSENMTFDRLRASQDNATFLPVSYLGGSSLLEGNDEIVPFTCPLTGRRLHAVPPADPDVVVLHVAAADQWGNALVPSNRLLPQGVDIIASRACERLILTTERLVETTYLQRRPDLVQIPSYRTEGVVWAPWGAHPTSMLGYYDIDETAFEELVESGRTDEAFESHLKRTVHSVKDHDNYLAQVGLGRLLALQRRSRS
ncbi:CoA transferase subunit A [Saccharopolyspora tripterygii]